MVEFAKTLSSIDVEDELKQSYLDYAMSVIVGRALPDVRDGLKPVHRRVLYAKHELNNYWNRPYKKSARIVGDVIGKYHPHGDTAVYDTIVRMAQPFSLRYMLVDGQGNFGSVDGDAPAAMRYTEVRMSAFAHTLLADLDKDTVDFAPNYDGTESAPVVLPTRVPNLLVNGSSGIAVGMATNIPPHNLGEVINACIALIDNPELTLSDLLELIPGPDFPTHGIINGRKGIIDAYKTGRGRIHLRARCQVEPRDKDKESIIVTELPYQVNKARLIEKMAELVKEKRLEGISGLRDESDKDGMRIVIELKRGENSEVILNNLYKLTQLQTVFGINMVALMNNEPKVLNLHSLLDAFLRHRREVVTRRTNFELRKAKNRAHLLEGLAVALTSIDPIISLIKKASTPAIAKEALLAQTWPAGMVIDMLAKTSDENSSRPDELAKEFGLNGDHYRLSPEQAQAILELRLHRLTGLEQDKIFAEYEEILVQIAELMAILSSSERLLEVIREELIEVKEKFSDDRRTEIRDVEEELNDEDLIPQEERVVTLSNEGYIKTQSLDDYQAQRRGGKGKRATTMKEEDFVEKLVIANSHDTLLSFTNKGRLYWKKVYQLPAGSRQSRGRPVINILQIEEGERINAMVAVREFSEDHFVVMATSKGTIKKVPLSAFSNQREKGIIAIGLDEGDYLIGVELTTGENDLMLFTTDGKAIRFDEAGLRAMGRTARGVRGIKVAEGQKVISLVTAKAESLILTATEHGFGKCTPLEEYRLCNRGGQGVISIKTSERNGSVVGAVRVESDGDVMLITDQGTLVRTSVEGIAVSGRNTQGVRLIRPGDNELLTEVQSIPAIEGDELSEEVPDQEGESDSEEPGESDA